MEEWNMKSEKFHVETRAFQLTEMNDPTFGMAHPWWVFSNDQVPICLSSECIMTVEDKGLDIVYDAAGKDLDTNHFCTLNLCGPMLLRDDKANQTKPHLVFRGAFKDGEDWRDQDEKDQWDPRVVVTFQENAWIDGKSHMLFLEKVLGPVNARLKQLGLKGVIFQDNLSSYTTEDVKEFFAEKMDQFCEPKFIPALMTFILQVIDRHIGKMYKYRVYLKFRVEVPCCSNETYQGCSSCK